jgi:hypothetical protein
LPKFKLLRLTDFAHFSRCFAMKRLFFVLIGLLMLSSASYSQSPVFDQEIQLQAGLLFNTSPETFPYGGYTAGFEQARRNFSPGLAYAFHSKFWGVEISTGYREISFRSRFNLPADTNLARTPMGMTAHGHYLNTQGTVFLKICESEKSDVRIGAGMGTRIRLWERYQLWFKDGGIYNQESGSIFRNLLTYFQVQMSYRKFFLERYFVDVRGVMHYNFTDIEPSQYYISPLPKKQFSFNLGLGMKLQPKTADIGK